MTPAASVPAHALTCSTPATNAPDAASSRQAALAARLGLLLLVLSASAPACGPATTATSDAVGGDASPGADATADAPGGDDTGLGGGDVALDCPGGLGCPCESPNDCNIAYCLETQDGGRCTKLCGDGLCPTGWVCEGTTAGADGVYFCVQPQGLLCRPCNADADCRQGGHAQARCVDYGDQGAFCGVACKADDDCPTGRVCRDVPSVEGGATSQQCVVPGTTAETLGTCDCSAAARDTKLATTCWQPEDGPAGPRRCKGSRSCGSDGLGACELLQGAAAVCIEEQCLDPKTKQPLAKGSACNDGRACTKGEACDGAGACTGGEQTCPCEPGFLDCPQPSAGDVANLCKGKPYCAAKLVGDGIAYTCLPNPGTTKVCDASLDGACVKNACAPLTGGCQPTPTERTVEICDLAAPVGSDQPGCRREILAADLPSAATPACDDGLSCSKNDGCSDGSCKADTSACKCVSDADCVDDGDMCNGKPFCNQGGLGADGKPQWQCKTNPATIVTCDTSGDTGCQKTACQPADGVCKKSPAPLGSPCDDGVACTSGDTCAADGSCSAGAWTCCNTDADCKGEEDGNLCNGTLYCNKAEGGCKLNPSTIVVCPSVDNTACLQSVCQVKTGTCALTITNDLNFCDDGNACTKGELCDQGLCKGGTDVCKCANDADCAALEDGDFCNGTFYCDPTAGPGGTGACKLNPKTVVSCPSVNDTACNRNLCAPKTGICAMTKLKEATPCDADGTACTANDACDGKGSCQPGALACECVSDADCASKDDGDVCNGTLFCDKSGADGKGHCVVNPATVKSCPSASDTACTKNTCDPQTGQCAMKAAPPSTLCEDGDLCTVNDVCDGKGACTSGKATCGCTKDEQCALFDDGDLCNGAYLCVNSKCIFDPKPKVCNDGNACTNDSCDTKTGCSFTANTDPCDADGSACTANDACKGGSCVSGDPKSCDDGEPCTTDSCDKATGTCAHKAVSEGQTCGNNGNGACAAGVCLLSAESVHAGSNHTCAVLKGGAVACWGANDLTQLGIGGAGVKSRPVMVPGVANITKLAVGRHTCGLRADGTVVCWGPGESGQLGNTKKVTSSGPVDVFGFKYGTDVTVGDEHACALTPSGITCWGSNGKGQAAFYNDVPEALKWQSTKFSNYTLFDAGPDFTCGVVPEANTKTYVRCSGSNLGKALGPAIATTTNVPTTVFEFMTPVGPPRDMRQGPTHGVLLHYYGVMFFWGRNDDGQFGTGVSNSTTQAGTQMSSNDGYVDVDVGLGFTCAVRDKDFVVQCWGRNDKGQLGDGSTTKRLTPTAVSGASAAKQVSAGDTHACYRRNDGRVFCWGEGKGGKLGNGVYTNQTKPVAVLAPL